MRTFLTRTNSEKRFSSVTRESKSRDVRLQLSVLVFSRSFGNFWLESSSRSRQRRARTIGSLFESSPGRSWRNIILICSELFRRLGYVLRGVEYVQHVSISGGASNWGFCRGSRVQNSPGVNQWLRSLVSLFATARRSCLFGLCRIPGFSLRLPNTGISRHLQTIYVYNWFFPCTSTIL